VDCLSSRSRHSKVFALTRFSQANPAACRPANFGSHAATPKASTIAANKYQFFTRSESGPKYLFLNARSLRINLGIFNRHKPQADGTKLDGANTEGG